VGEAWSQRVGCRSHHRRSISSSSEKELCGPFIKLFHIYFLQAKHLLLTRTALKRKGACLLVTTVVRHFRRHFSGIHVRGGMCMWFNTCVTYSVPPLVGFKRTRKD
jgi:hypothetical protein